MNIFLVIYFIINMPIGIFCVVAPLVCALVEDYKTIYHFFWAGLKDRNVNKLGRIIALTFYTLLFAPVLILSHLILLITFLGTKAAHLYCEIFKERKD